MQTPSDFSRDVGAHLADFMRERGLTQTQVADEMGRAQGFVSERLTGTRAPTTDLIATVARMAGLHPRALMVELLARMSAATTAPGGTRTVPSRPAHGHGPSDARDGRDTRHGRRGAGRQVGGPCLQDPALPSVTRATRLSILSPLTPLGLTRPSDARPCAETRVRLRLRPLPW